MAIIHREIEPEDLARLREVWVRIQVAESGNPNVNAEEAHRAFRDDIAVCTEMLEKYDVDPEADWNFNIYTGHVTYDG